MKFQKKQNIYAYFNGLFLFILRAYDDDVVYFVVVQKNYFNQI